MKSTTTAKSQPTIEIEREAFTISEWCRSIGISRAFFYKLDPAKRPRIIKLGRRVLISRDAAADWQQEMELATAQDGGH